jgi:hypothetical protein
MIWYFNNPQRFVDIFKVILLLFPKDIGIAKAHLSIKTNLIKHAGKNVKQMFFFNLYIICSIIPRIHLDFFELFALIF